MGQFKILILLFIFGFVAFVSSADNKQVASYSKECLTGPTHWCSSLKAARSCKAVNHCIQTVWSKKVLSEDNDDICHACKDMIQKAKATLLSNDTKRDIRVVLETSCKLIPVKMIKEECLKITDQFVPEILEMLAARMNPQAVCSTMGLCNSNWIDEILAEYDAAREEVAEPQSVRYQCQYCQHTVNKVKESSEDDARMKIFELCERTGEFADTCIALAIEYFDDQYKIFMDRLKNSDVCNQLHFCNTYDKDRKLEQQGVQSTLFVANDDVQCEFCESLVQHVRDILIVNTTELEFKVVLESLCKQAGSFEKQCFDLVGQYHKTIYDFLSNGLDPKETCRLMALCPNPGEKQNLNQFPFWMMPISISSSEESDDSSENKHPEEIDPSSKANRFLYQLLNGDEGNGAADDYIDVVQLNKELETDDIILDDVTLGDLLRSIDAMDAVEDPSYTLGKVSNTSFCLICEYAMNELDKRLSTNSTEEEIRQTLDNLCAYLPSTVAEMCISFIDKYGDDVYQMLIQKLVPKAICVQIGLCMSAGPSGMISIPYEPEEEAAAGIDTCEVCEIVIAYLDEELEDDTIEEGIEQIAQRACDLVPKRSQPTCTAVVSNYGPYLISQLGIIGYKREVCEKVHLCIAQKVPAVNASGERHLVGKEECTWGPSHWCSSMENAKSCNALEHCQKLVWFKAAP